MYDFLAPIFIILGLLNIIFPDKVIKFRHILTFKSCEPTQFAISGTVISGVILIVIGIVILLSPVY